MFNFDAAPLLAPTILPPLLGNSLHIPQVQLPGISPRDSLTRQPEFNHLNTPTSCPPTSTCTQGLMPAPPPVVKCKIFLLRLDSYNIGPPREINQRLLQLQMEGSPSVVRALRSDGGCHSKSLPYQMMLAWCLPWKPRI